MSADLPNYYFIPAVREGLAAFIAEEATGERVTVNAQLTPIVDGTLMPDQAASMRVGLYGPGDVLGFSSSLVTRTDPRGLCWDYEPNFMPLIEFSEPDLPWRFTPSVAGSEGLQPWIALIVLKAGEFDGLEERQPDTDRPDAPAVRWINQVQVTALPDLESAWRWAHVQVTAEDSLSGSELVVHVSAAPGSAGSHVVARLLCPRRLAPRTRYTAFVVPTFKLGQVAAGLATLGASETAFTPGWDAESAATVNLPYYYKWEFATGTRGDFEYLVRLLQPRSLPSLGRRRMDCTRLPYGLPPCPGVSEQDEEVLAIEGALMSPQMEPAQWTNETSAISAFRRELAGVLNLAADRLTASSGSTAPARPAVVPPIFGRRHSRRDSVTAGNFDPWVDDVNLDPRLRAAAGVGALVVNKQQEALMASVWDQLGDIELANQALLHGQVGLEASRGLFTRLGRLSTADFLWTAAPLFGRVLTQSVALPVSTVANALAASPIPRAAFDPAFRRLLRRGGGMRKVQGSARPPASGWDTLTRLNEKDILPAGAPPRLEGMPSMCRITDAALAELERQAEPQREAQNLFRLNGRVIDGARRPLAGVCVEAWDRDVLFTDKLGNAVTNERGAFRIEFDQQYFQERFLDRRPDIFIKVRRRGRELKVVSPRVLRDVAAGDTDVIVEVREPADADAGAFRIEGRVIDRASGNGAAWLRVEAWDRDPFRDDYIGSTLSGAEGEFRIAFDLPHFAERGMDRQPDVYLKVLHAGTQIGTQSVIRDLRPGVTSVDIEIDAPTSLPTPPDGPLVADFCEAAITCDAVFTATAPTGSTFELHQAAARAICDGVRGWLGLQEAPAPAPEPVDLSALQETMKAALAPAVTIPARIASRYRLGPGVHQSAPCGLLESEIDFPQPMYEPLAEISQDLILPGVQTVPQNTITLLKTNRRFMEAYMLGLNDALASEVLWRGAPVYLWTTFFRQFWDVSGWLEDTADADSAKDISRLSTWSAASQLGDHAPTVGGSAERAVTCVRGDVLKRYPHTLVYAIPALADGQPALDEFAPGREGERLWPIFSGTLAPDLTFFGFDRTPEQLRNENGRGYYLVLEERLGEPRFGFDDPATAAGNSEGQWWYNLTWGDLQPNVSENEYVNDAVPAGSTLNSPAWSRSAATAANICLQRPVRIIIHASKMLPESAAQ